MLLILLWVSSVLSNVVHCTTAGAVACWWVSTDDELIAVDECERERESGIPFSVSNSFPNPLKMLPVGYGRINTNNNTNNTNIEGRNNNTNTNINNTNIEDGNNNSGYGRPWGMGMNPCDRDFNCGK